MLEGKGLPGPPLVAIGSKNPAKTKGVRSVFPEFFPGCTFVEVDTSSVAKAQPIGMEQVLSGASKRARFALSPVVGRFRRGRGGRDTLRCPHANTSTCRPLSSSTRRAARGRASHAGSSSQTAFIERMRKEGMELDRYSHELTGAERISEEEGIVYHVSKGRVSRLQMTEQCVSMALIPWLNKKAYGF